METALPSGAQAQKRTLSCLLFACVNLPTAKAELACFNLITIYGCAKSGSRMSRFRLLTDTPLSKLRLRLSVRQTKQSVVGRARVHG